MNRDAEEATLWREHHLCRGCAHIGTCRIGLRKSIEANGIAIGRITLGPELMGGPGIAHGGYVAIIFDEVCGLVPLAQQVPHAVTRRLRVEYRKPVPIGRALEVEARLVERHGRDLRIEAELRLASSGGVLAAGEALFREVVGHYARYDEWLTRQGPAAAPPAPE